MSARTTIRRLLAALTLTGAATSPLAAADFHTGLPLASIAAAGDTLQTALETLRSGARADWVGADEGFGYVKPLRTWKSKSGHWCREFEERVYTSTGDRINRRAVACRTGEGQWVITGV